jgi:hypothetical protein
MPFRFRTSIRIAPGVRLNFSRSGVSTTLGGRGLSVNLGRGGTRLTTGIPGSGVSYTTRAGGTGRGAAAAPPADGAAGCLGCGSAGFLLLLMMGFCASPDGPPPRALYAGDTTAVVLSTSAPAEPRETFYIHAPLNVRSGAGKNSEKLRTLGRGERVTLGAKDGRGWAAMYDGYGQRVGYVYRASDNVRSYAPRAAAATMRRPRRHPSGASAICRDGTYSYSANRRGTCSWHGGVSRWL